MEKKKMKKMSLIIIAAMFMTVSIAFSSVSMEYQHNLKVKDMEFSWTIEGENIHVMVSAKTTGWVGIGFGPDDAMMGANIIIGAVKEGKVRIEDHYGARKRGHKNDKKLGGKNNVMNPSGTEIDGITTISFTLPLNTGDEWDKPIDPAGTTRVIMAHGAGKDSFKNRHPFRTVYDIDLSTGKSEKVK